MDIRTSGTEVGSFSYISNIDSAYRLEAPERKLSFDLLLAWVENDNEEEDMMSAATTVSRSWAWWLVVQVVVFEIILRDASILTRREAARRSACDGMMLMMRSIDEFALWYYWWWLLLLRDAMVWYDVVRAYHRHHRPAADGGHWTSTSTFRLLPPLHQRLTDWRFKKSKKGISFYLFLPVFL